MQLCNDGSISFPLSSQTLPSKNLSKLPTSRDSKQPNGSFRPGQHTSPTPFLRLPRNSTVFDQQLGDSLLCSHRTVPSIIKSDGMTWQSRSRRFSPNQPFSHHHFDHRSSHPLRMHPSRCFKPRTSPNIPLHRQRYLIYLLIYFPAWIVSCPFNGMILSEGLTNTRSKLPSRSLIFSMSTPLPRRLILLK